MRGHAALPPLFAVRRIDSARRLYSASDNCAIERDPDLSPEASTALGLLFVLLVLVAQAATWVFLMLDRPSGGVHRTTIWTFVLFVPEAVIFAGLIAGIAVRGPGGRVFSASLLVSITALALVVYLYASEPSREWSLPVVPPFGGGNA